MAIKIFKSLFHEKINSFSNLFTETSKSIYYDEEKKQLIHSGEFGSYRESLCKEFLKFFIPMQLEIDNGFVINASNEISTQCDLVIYDKGVTPLIRSEEHQKFYLVESVIGVGEVKSTLSFNQLKTALRKLSESKKIRENVKNTKSIGSVIEKATMKDFNPQENYTDQLFTFLICEKLNFKYKDLVDNFDSIYDSIDPIYRHNMILSIKDGLFLYHEDDSPAGT